MNRAPLSFGATVVAVAFGAGVLVAQTPPPAAAPPMKSVLAGKKLTPPAKGEVIVEYTAPALKTQGEDIITTFQVKNIGVSPIARLTISQTWFDKAGSVVGGGKGAVEGLFQPGDVQTISITSPKKTTYANDSYNFTHANGTVKPKRVAKVTKNTAPDAAAAKPAEATKK